METNPQNLKIPAMLNHYEFSGSSIIKFISRLTQLIFIERIYLSRFDYGGTNFKKLTILIPTSSKMHISEARPLVEMVLADHPEYRFGLFYVHEVKRALQYGSMVFYTICRDENLIYQTERYNTVLSLDISAKAILKKAKRSFEKDWKKVRDFREGFDFYFTRENYPFAAFMLHQVIELGYRGVEILLIGREKISHSIRSHQKLLEAYDPELANIFDQEDEAEMAMLSLLEESYGAVRYEQDYMIEKDQLLSILSKADLMEKKVFELYNLMVAQFRIMCRA